MFGSDEASKINGSDNASGLDNSFEWGSDESDEPSADEFSQASNDNDSELIRRGDNSDKGSDESHVAFGSDDSSDGGSNESSVTFGSGKAGKEATSDLGFDEPSVDDSSLASDAGVLLVDTDEDSDPIQIGNSNRKRLRKR